jgi:drug/metabolite transporter (DMT)-like permease
MKVGVVSLPPFAMVSLRFTIAGAVLWLWCRLVRKSPLPTLVQWRDAALTGTLMLVMSNAVFAWTLQYLPSGIDALVFALTPLWMTLMGAYFYGERIAKLSALGLALGLIGMLYLYLPSGGQHLPPWPTAIALSCSLSWAIGSLVQRRLRGADVVQVSAMQMFVAAAVLALTSLGAHEHLVLADFTPPAIGALGYLIVFGSLVGFSAYLWLLNNVSSSLASTNAYINPVVALAIGIGLLHERASLPLFVGGASIVVGVALMAWSNARATRATTPTIRDSLSSALDL